MKKTKSVSLLGKLTPKTEPAHISETERRRAKWTKFSTPLPTPLTIKGII